MSVLLTLLSDLLSFQINETLGKPVHEEAQTYFALNMPHCISATTHYALIKENPLFDFYKDNIMRSLSQPHGMSSLHLLALVHTTSWKNLHKKIKLENYSTSQLNRFVQTSEQNC